ncbi:MAG: phosphatidylglycerol lysyltransferase [Treponema sp.]|jgi:phosphoglucomutase|nr:phosphatidylglycerol lysyltransferase [Treponema sp.]
MFDPDKLRIPGADLAKALSEMILSPSGWRGIFGASEEDRSGELSKPHALICAAGAVVFAEFLRSGGSPAPLVILGRDTRPTGEAAADIMIRAFLGAGCAAVYAGVAAAPELMACAASYAKNPPAGGHTGFCYISASHNPIGHNGLKFGLDDGGVLEASAALQCIGALKELLARPGAVTELLAVLCRADETGLKRVYAESARIKQEALGAYRDFALRVTAGTPVGVPDGGNGVMEALKEGLRERPLTAAADYNGSARTLSIDGDLFRSLGLGFQGINAKPGEIAHAIIPEGDSLEPCRVFLEELHRRDTGALLSYVPDCDGDRGNLVIWDEEAGRARILEAQEVFALACAAEFAQLVWTGELRYGPSGGALTRAAVAVNGPTSMRVDRIAAAFGIEVFRAEVGEANVVNLARRLRNQGYLVRILGEGSNGGNIIHPQAVRDPIATVLGLVKLLTIRKGRDTDAGGPRPEGGGFFDIWLEKSGGGRAKSGFGLKDIIASLPVFTTTGVATPEAQLRVRTGDHALLKEKYQGIFLKDWELKRAELKRLGLYGWEGRACIGTEEVRKLTRFGDAGTGGLKIVFTGDEGREKAFIWMRGSKTEPVFRILADAEGGAERERALIQWQRSMVSRADGAA